MNIFFYYTHEGSLGHATRTLTIAQNLSKIASVYVFNGGKKQPFFKISQSINYFNLPYPFYHRNSQLNYLSIEKKHVRARINFIKSQAERVGLDIFITEFFPFGRLEYSYELVPLISYFKKQGVKICASIGYPTIISENSKVLKTVAPFYNKFFIHTPDKLELKYLLPGIKNPFLKELYNYFFNQYKKNIVWTNYVLPKEVHIIEKKSLPTLVKKKIRILISRGSGKFYSKLILLAILAKKYLPENYNLDIVAGPSSAFKELQLFKELADKIKGVSFKESVKNLSYHLKRSDVSVSMAGYNTSVQLMYFRKRAIVIPLIKKNFGKKDTGIYSEQLGRANILKDYFGATMLDYDSLTSQILAQAIKQKINQSKPNKISKQWFSGAETVTKSLQRLC